MAFGLCEEMGKFCNYQNFKDAYSFLTSNKIRCSLWQLSLIGSSYFVDVTNCYWLCEKFCMSFADRVSKNKKESLLQALTKLYTLTSCELFYTNFCARNQFLFRIKGLSKFLYICFKIWAFHLLKQWLVVKHTVVSMYT